jgi:uncharacterized membrane protein
VSEANGQARKPGRYFDRESVEFARVVAFTDGLFAIAATLLVVGIEVPELSDPESLDELADALGDLLPSIVGFVIGFVVIGRYWFAHHSFFSQLRGLNRGLIALNLLYLMFIAFMPFPTGILGDYFANPLSIALYASIVAAASGLEVVMFRHAYRAQLLNAQISERVYRWGALTSFLPVVFFAVSIPIAFASTTVALLVWAAQIPFQRFIDRYAPEGADDVWLG